MSNTSFYADSPSFINPILPATKGDIIVGNGTTWVALPPQADGQVLTLDSTQTTGVKWASSTISVASITVGTTGVVGGTSGNFLYDNAGVLGERTAAQATAALNLFTSTLPGLAPASGGGTTNFLRADGTWAAPPADPVFNSTTAGDVPASGGGTTNFLRADGTWTAAGAPPGGASPDVQFNAGGGAFAGDAGFTYAGNGAATLALGTDTTNRSALSITGTWNNIATTGASGTGTTATLTFAAQASAFPVGTSITVAGVTPAGYNGTFTVTASTTTSVSYANTTTGAQTVAGTIATTFDAPLFMNITNTASNAASLLADLQVGGTTQFKVSANGYAAAFNGVSVGLTQLGGPYTFSGGVFCWNIYNLLSAGSSLEIGSDGSTNPYFGIGLSAAWSGFPGGSPGFSDTRIYRDAANIWGIRNGGTVAPQALRVYNTNDTGAAAPTNYERLTFSWGGNVAFLGTEKGGTGTARELRIFNPNDTTSYLSFAGNAQVTWANGNGNNLTIGLGSPAYFTAAHFHGGYAITAGDSLAAPDVLLSRVGAGVFSIHNGTSTSAAGLAIYNTSDVLFGTGTNYERLSIDWTTTANTATIAVQSGGTGSNLRTLAIVCRQGIVLDASGNSSVIAQHNGSPCSFAINNGNPNTGFGIASLGVLGYGVIVNTAAGYNPPTGGGSGFLQWGGQSRVSADQTFTSTTTLANVSGLSINLAAGRTYNFVAEISWTDAAAGGLQLAIGGTCTATNIIYDGYIIDSGANGIKGNAQATALGGAVASATTTGTAGHARIAGTITVNLAGTLTVQAAQNTSNATATTIKRGSYFYVWDVA